MKQTRSTRTILVLLVISLLAGVMNLVDSAQAQTTANGPYYATPSWDQTLPAATRFVVLSNFGGAAVLDRETGLVWERSLASSVESWDSARFTCANKTVGGRKGWRLPSMPELASLIDPSVAFPGPTIPSGHPFIGVLGFFYWSATTWATSPGHAWILNSNNGILQAGDKTDTSLVWCVRGGSNADAY